jgi:hypothetical protein
MANHYTLEVFAVDVQDSIGREEDIVTIEIQGELKASTKRAISEAIAREDWTLRFKKKVLA